MEDLLSQDDVDKLPYIPFCLPPRLQRQQERHEQLANRVNHASSVTPINATLAAVIYEEILLELKTLQQRDPLRIDAAKFVA